MGGHPEVHGVHGIGQASEISAMRFAMHVAMHALHFAIHAMHFAIHAMR
jgi:hypothetical protein